MSSIGNSLLRAAVRFFVVSAKDECCIGKEGRFKVHIVEDTSQQVDSGVAA